MEQIFDNVQTLNPGGMSCWGFIFATVVFPFSLCEMLPSLRYSSLISFCSAIYVTFVITILFFKNSITLHNDAKSNWEPKFQLLSLSICLFAFTCQTNICGIYKELRQKQKSGPKVLLITLVVILLVYCLFGLFGYLKYAHSPELFIPKSMNDVAVLKSAMISITISLMFDIPVLIYPTLDVCFRLLFSQIYKAAPFWQRLLGVLCTFHTVSIYSAALFAALGSNSYVTIVGTLGAVSSVYISAVLPCVLYLKRGRTLWLKKVCWCLLTLTGLVCAAGAAELLAVF